MAYKDPNDPRLKEARLKWYYKNKEKQLAKQKKAREIREKWFKMYKKKQFCKSCEMSFNDYPECCDFHHLDPTLKKGNVFQIVRSYTMATVMKELKKCIPLCANCHRKLHAKNKRDQFNK